MVLAVELNLHIIEFNSINRLYVEKFFFNSTQNQQNATNYNIKK
jgi:hypothetical protein